MFQESEPIVEDLVFETAFPNLPDGVLEYLGLLDDGPRYVFLWNDLNDYKSLNIFVREREIKFVEVYSNG